MRYPLEGRNTIAGLTKGGGLLAGAVGLARGLGKRAIGPMAVPLAIGAGLLWLGRSLGDAFVDISGDQLHVKLGVIFDETLPLSAIESVEESTWGLLGGLGVRTNLRGTVAVTTKAGAVAEITFKEPRRLPLLPKVWSMEAKRLVVSPENLGGFIAELRSRLAGPAVGD
jgi:hypothetical protein